MPDPIALQRAKIAELASRMIAKNPGNAGAIMQQLKDAGLDISGNPIEAQPPFSPTIAGRPPTPPPTGFPPAPPLGGLTAADRAIPFRGTGGAPNSLRSMADRGDPSQAPDFRSRLNAAFQTAGSARVPPGSGLAIANTDPTAPVQGQLPSDFMSPGNLPRPRPFESPIAARPGGPPGGFPAAAGPPPPLNAVRPEGPPGGLPAAPPSMAQGPMPGRETMGPPSPLASRFGDQSQLAGDAFSGPPSPMARMPQARPPQMPQARPFESLIAARPEGPPSGFPPAAGPPTPTSVATQGGFKPLPGFDQPLRSVPPSASLPPLSPAAMDARVGAVSPETTLPPSAMDARAGVTTPSAALNPLQRAPLNLAAGAGLSGPPPVGLTNMPFATSASFGSVGQRMVDASLPPGLPPVKAAQTPLIAVPLAKGTVPPVGTVTGQDLSALPPVGVPASLASVGPPNPARMEVVANYNQPPPGMPPPPGMTLPPGVTLPDVGRLGFGDTNVDPSKAPVHRYGSNTGKYAGAALGAIKGLAGGPVGAVVGGALGYKGGKRLGGLADRDFGLGARFSNPNYGQGIVANPPPIMGVEPISQPVDVPITSGTGGIFGQGRRMVGGAMQKALAAVTGGKMSPDAAAKAFGVSKDSLHDSLGSFGSGGRGMGGGNNYSGGSYGGYGGSRINEGIGGAYRNR